MRRTACDRCRSRKLKCDKSKPCRQCLQSGHDCIAVGVPARRSQQVPIAKSTGYRPVVLEEHSVVDLGKELLHASSDYNHLRSIDAIPGSIICSLNDTTSFTWRDELAYTLPSTTVLDALSDSYFSSVNWFMMVVDEASFRERSNLALATEQMKTTDRNFCFLLSLVWGLGAHYLWVNPDTSLSLPISTSMRFAMISVIDLVYARIMSYPTLEAVQIAVLLGSFHLFNGTPYLGFAMFGSGIRCAQAIGLHRQSRGSTAESRAVWWALEIADKYAAAAFGLPCGIDESDCDVPDIIDDAALVISALRSSKNVTSLTYHRLKARLYRVMGSFLGRRRQAAQGRSLMDIHHELTAWYDTVPGVLRYNNASHELNDQPMLLQMQALSLQLAYDNLQMVLFRQAVFPINRQEVTPHRANNIRQLSQSAIRTATISTLAATRSICRSSHASIHVGICSFTAGVVLCKLLASETSDREKEMWFVSLQEIITFFEQFPSENYRFAIQSLEFLKVLEAHVNPQASSIPSGRVLLRSQAQADMFNNIVEPYGDPVAFVYTDTSSSLEPGVHGPVFVSNGPLDDISQSWLWTDDGNEHWLSGLL